MVWLWYILPNYATRFGLTAFLGLSLLLCLLSDYLDRAIEVAWKGRNEYCYIAWHLYSTCVLPSLGITPQLVHWQERVAGIKNQ